MSSSIELNDQPFEDSDFDRLDILLGLPVNSSIVDSNGETWSVVVIDRTATSSRDGFTLYVIADDKWCTLTYHPGFTNADMDAFIQADGLDFSGFKALLQTFTVPE